MVAEVAGRFRRGDAGAGQALDGAGWLAFRQGDYAAAVALFAEAANVLERSGDREGLARTLSNQGLLHLLAGNGAEARRLLEASVAVTREIDARAVEIGPLFMLSMLSYFEGDHPGAETNALASLAIARQLGNRKTIALVAAAMANLKLDQGDLLAAHEYLDQSLGISQELGERVNSQFVLEVCARCAETESKPERTLVLASAASSLRELTGARSLPPWQKLVDDAVARARAAMGPSRAAGAWRQGATTPFEGIFEWARHDTAPPASSPRPVPVPPSPLTRREKQIADLVAQGLSNKAVAERLVIGHRTVETHVENILNKLGFNSRAEIAAWAGERRNAPSGG